MIWARKLIIPIIQVIEITNLVLKQGKHLTAATWDAAGTALSGLGTALCQVGSSIGQGTKTIVQKKYGNDVATTYLGGEV